MAYTKYPPFHFGKCKRLNVKKYQAELKALGIDWKPPTMKEIACGHEFDKPYKRGVTRTCIKCGAVQTN